MMPPTVLKASIWAAAAWAVIWSSPIVSAVTYA